MVTIGTFEEFWATLQTQLSGWTPLKTLKQAKDFHAKIGYDAIYIRTSSDHIFTIKKEDLRKCYEKALRLSPNLRKVTLSYSDIVRRTTAYVTKIIDLYFSYP